MAILSDSRKMMITYPDKPHNCQGTPYSQCQYCGSTAGRASYRVVHGAQSNASSSSFAPALRMPEECRSLQEGSRYVKGDRSLGFADGYPSGILPVIDFTDPSPTWKHACKTFPCPVCHPGR
ncbi:unnamed protein product [Sphagnum jensenii]|uniref:Uncharacterized protein n=2 Tax=Sphagnum jensenii TaxID=128206 RepID=A0ABP0WV76_9BRYO